MAKFSEPQFKQKQTINNKSLISMGRDLWTSLSNCFDTKKGWETAPISQSEIRTHTMGSNTFQSKGQSTSKAFFLGPPLPKKRKIISAQASRKGQIKK